MHCPQCRSSAVAVRKRQTMYDCGSFDGPGGFRNRCTTTTASQFLWSAIFVGAVLAGLLAI